jgi:hypothetical protein
MAAGKYSFTLEQGVTTILEFQYKDADENPIDLTGYSGRMQIKSDYADNSPVTYATISSSLAVDGTGLDFSGSNGETPPTSGSIGLYISAASSSAFNFDTAKYDLELYNGDQVIRLVEGTIKLSREVTRI